MIAAILVGLFVVLVTVWYLNFYRYNRYLKSIPGPRPLPLIGNALDYGSLEDILPQFLKLQEKYGGIIKQFLGFAPPFLLVTDVKLTEYVLGSTKILNKADDYSYLMKWLGTGLLTSTGAKWKKHRKIITPAFHFQILEQFVEIFDSFSDIMIKKLKKEVGRDSTDIYPYVTLCSLDIICATSMGTVVNAQENADSEYVKSVKEMCRIVIERSIYIYKSYDLLYFFSKDYWKERKALKVLHDYTYSVINARKEKLENGKEENNSDFEEDVGIKKKKTLLDTLLEYKKEGQPLTDLEIREQVDTFLFGGHDTTSSAISFVFYCLASHPEVQERAVQELSDIFGDDKERPITYRDLQEMKYLEAVIKETLRLYPSVPFYARNLHEDVEYDGKILPKGLEISIFAYGIHRCPENYPDPERFDPERFILDQTKRSAYAFVPFSAGPRNCIGQKFAMLEMKSIVSKVLRRYELLPTAPQHKLILVPETVLKSKSGVRIRLRDRKI